MQPKYTFNIGIVMGSKPVRAVSVLVFAADTPIDKPAIQHMLLEHIKEQTHGPHVGIGVAIDETLREAREQFGYQAVHVPTDVSLQMGFVRLDDDPDAPTRQEML